MRGLLVLTLALTLTFASRNNAPASDIYVDNLLGNDSFDGQLVLPIDSGSGPVRTLRRAMHLAGFGDRIVLTQAGGMYYDSLSLTGTRHSGTSERPFTIIGNGATISGARAVPQQGWRRTGPDLWKLTLTRKGFYRLLRDGQSLPELQPEAGANPLETLAAGQWTAWRGDVYYRADGDAPTTQSFAYAAEQTGLSLYQVEHVRIVGLTLRDFRFDGLRTQNMCRGVTLENVNCLNNGRAGIAVSGTSHIEMVGGSLAENGRHSLLVSNPATANLREVTTDVEPTVIVPPK
ncbi:MAG: right-handed parallel beta-helix repeat-containing protein [Planctomycetota bacterium]